MVPEPDDTTLADAGDYGTFGDLAIVLAKMFDLSFWPMPDWKDRVGCGSHLWTHDWTGIGWQAVCGRRSAPDVAEGRHRHCTGHAVDWSRSCETAGLPWDEQRFANDADITTRRSARVFRKQLADFGGDHEKAAAAYNAGPVVRRRLWLALTGTGRLAQLSSGRDAGLHCQDGGRWVFCYGHGCAGI